MFDVSLVQAPVASPRAERPKPLLYMATGLALALLLGRCWRCMRIRLPSRCLPRRNWMR